MTLDMIFHYRHLANQAIAETLQIQRSLTYFRRYAVYLLEKPSCQELFKNLQVMVIIHGVSHLEVTRNAL